MWQLAAAAAGMGALACCLRSAYERHHFTTDVYELTSKKITEKKTFVFLSDLHNNCFGRGQERLLAAIREVKPDGVLVGGDMMVVKERAELDTALFLVGELARQYPVYYGNGNHESRIDRKRWLYGDQYDVFVRRLKEAGVCHLSDASIDFSGGIRISGLDLERRYYEKRVSDRLDVSYIEKRLGKASEEKYEILLAHSPLFRKAYARWGADLTLSGHFHGGTIRIPGMGGVMTPQHHFFLESCAGCLVTEGRAMIVSRGLGTHSINIRLNNMSQLVVVTLCPAS